jgi:hypothetical protein
MALVNYKAETVIKKTVGQVFGFVSELRNLALWAGASDVEMISETPNRIGSIYKVTYHTFLSRSSILVEITEYKFPNVFSFRDNSKMILYNYYLLQNGDDARVSLTCGLNDEPFSFSKAKMDKILADLKKYLEGHDVK